MTKAKQAVGLPVELEEDQVAITYYLLRPKEAELEPEPLVLGELNTVFLEKEWKVAKLTSKYKDGEYYGMWGFQYTIVRCLRISKEGNQDTIVAHGYLDQSQRDRGMLRSKDPQLDLNSLRAKVQQPTGARSCWKLNAKCAACHSKCIMIY